MSWIINMMWKPKKSASPCQESLGVAVQQYDEAKRDFNAALAALRRRLSEMPVEA